MHAAAMSEMSAATRLMIAAVCKWTAPVCLPTFVSSGTLSLPRVQGSVVSYSDSLAVEAIERPTATIEAGNCTTRMIARAAMSFTVTFPMGKEYSHFFCRASRSRASLASEPSPQPGDQTQVSGGIAFCSCRSAEGRGKGEVFRFTKRFPPRNAKRMVGQVKGAAMSRIAILSTHMDKWVVSIAARNEIVNQSHTNGVTVFPARHILCL